MTKKRAAELQVGDLFYRDAYRDPTPSDWSYRVKGLQRIPMRDFFGKPLDMVQITGENHILGPATITLGVDELVWVVE